MKSKVILALLATSIMISAPSSAQDKEKVDPTMQHRQNVMEIVKYSLFGMRDIIKGDVKDQSQFSAFASAMASATSVAGRAFKQDTRGLEGKTTAKGDVWDNWQDFNGRMQDFDAAAQTLANVASEGDMKKNILAFKDLAKNCKGCHDEYRVKK